MADNADFATDLVQRHVDTTVANRPIRTGVDMARAECEECGDAIPAARREAAPWASTCIDCQEIQERKRRHVW
ncbi:TraR/DksA family transcriptional regulator [Halomonas elongata]|uniref:TraR/DksA family transcriptional regulator n=1 Tax=Halomonas elongata TaxID=2746 RepID=UPI00255A9F46|nr:TraR/DksA family transcriptional regulator [Halomonas elongata]MDL4862275.1 TraR/DksA family transcriptional regulator [Halomonas elongata]